MKITSLGRTHNKQDIFFIPLIILGFGWRIFIPEEDRGNGVFFQDDLYYYIVIAENYWAHGFPTFDGISETYGFQPLWQLVAILLATITGGENLVRGLLVLNLMLVLVVFIKAKQLLSLIKLPVLPLYWLYVALLTLPTLGQFLFNGMETALTFLFVLLALQSFVNHTIYRSSTGFMFGLYTGLAMLTRLDSFILFLVPYFYLLLKNNRYFFVASLTHLVFVVPVLLYLYLYTGDIVPVSGLVKNFYSNISAVGLSEQIINDSVPFLKYSFVGVPSYMVMKLSNSIMSPLFVLLWVTFFVWLVGNTNLYSEKTPSETLLFSLSFAVYAVYQLYYYNVHLIGLDNWTYGMVGVFLLYVTFIPICSLYRLVGNKISYDKIRNQVKPIAVITLGVLVLWVPLRFHQNHLDNRVSFGGKSNLYYIAAEWAGNNISESAIVGSWAAGQLGYLLNNNVVQLEGLVNSNDYLDVLREQEFVSYTCKMKIDYLFIYTDHNIYSDSSLFDFSEIISSRSKITAYRGLYLDQIKNHIKSVWVSSDYEIISGDEMGKYYIFEVDRDGLCSNQSYL